MQSIIEKTSSFIAMILIGFLLKKWKLLKKEDSKIVATLIMKLTLPCALLSSCKQIEINGITLLLVVIALLANITSFYLGVFAYRKKDPVSAGAYGLNISGFNIGNFAIPFAQAFFGSEVIGYICMFDIGNAICGFGLIYFLACLYSQDDVKFNFAELKDKLFSSVPFMTYCLIVVMSLLKIQLPPVLLNTVTAIGNGNLFLSMIYIGLLVEINFDKSLVKDTMGILTLRTLVQGVLVGVVMLMPVNTLVKTALLFCLFTPTTSVTPIYCQNLGYNGPIVALCSTLSMFIAIAIDVLLLFIIR